MNIRLLYRIILISLGSIFLIWFLIPLFSHKILNIGNITGILVNILLILLGCFLPKFFLALQHFKNSLTGKIILYGISTIFTAIFLLVIIETFCMARGALTRPVENTDAVIVLGCKVYGNKPSRMLRERLDAAYTYLSKNKYTLCVVSGGKGYDENISEAECMYQYLKKKGISPERLIKEGRSTSTKENIYFSNEKLAEYNFERPIAIVTNEFHQYRAKRIAKKLGLKTTAISGRTAPWLFPTYYVRELYGILAEWIFPESISAKNMRLTLQQKIRNEKPLFCINGINFKEGDSLNTLLKKFTISKDTPYNYGVKDGMLKHDLEDDTELILMDKNSKNKLSVLVTNNSSKDIPLTQATVFALTYTISPKEKPLTFSINGKRLMWNNSLQQMKETFGNKIIMQKDTRNYKDRTYRPFYRISNLPGCPKETELYYNDKHGLFGISIS